MDERLFEIRADRTTALALEVATRIHAGVAERGSASLVVTGGSTPGPLYDVLAEAPAPWDKTSVTLSDERWVSPDDPASNEHLIRERLLVGQAAAAWFVGLKTPAATPADAVATVEQSLQALPRPFDAVILGMGADGHIASLFPNAPELLAGLDPQRAELLIPVRRDEAAGASERLSLTAAALLDSRWIAILIDGEAKRGVYQQALAGTDVDELPVRAILNQTAVPVEIWWAP